MTLDRIKLMLAVVAICTLNVASSLAGERTPTVLWEFDPETGPYRITDAYEVVTEGVTECWIDLEIADTGAASMIHPPNGDAPRHYSYYYYDPDTDFCGYHDHNLLREDVATPEGSPLLC